VVRPHYGWVARSLIFGKTRRSGGPRINRGFWSGQDEGTPPRWAGQKKGPGRAGPGKAS